MDESKRCPFCGEEVRKLAKKCKHCGEWIIKNTETDTNSNSSSISTQKSRDYKPTFFDYLFLGTDILWGLLPIVLIICALIFVPNKSAHEKAIKKNAVECVIEESKNFADILSPGAGDLLSLFSNIVPANNAIAELFDKNNSIRYNKHWFWSTGEIINSLHPEGTMVSFGILGVVIPFVSWDDIVLLQYDKESTQNEVQTITNNNWKDIDNERMNELNELRESNGYRLIVNTTDYNYYIVNEYKDNPFYYYLIRFDNKTDRAYEMDVSEIYCINTNETCFIYSIYDVEEKNGNLIIIGDNGGNGMSAGFYAIICNLQSHTFDYIDFGREIEFVENRSIIRVTESHLEEEGDCVANNIYSYSSRYYNLSGELINKSN